MLLVLEGPDGCGKTTQARLLTEWLRDQGEVVTTCRDPGGTELGEAVRNILLHTKATMSPVAEMLLFQASRVQLLHETINPALARGEIVVLDRFVMSTIAYQGFGRMLPTDVLKSTIEQVLKLANFRTTPRYLYLQVPPQVLDQRIGSDRLERDRAFQGRLRGGYQAMTYRNAVTFSPTWVIDGDGQSGVVHGRIQEVVRPLLEGRKKK